MFPPQFAFISSATCFRLPSNDEAEDDRSSRKSTPSRVRKRRSSIFQLRQFVMEESDREVMLDSVYLSDLLPADYVASKNIVKLVKVS